MGRRNRSRHLTIQDHASIFGRARVSFYPQQHSHQPCTPSSSIYCTLRPHPTMLCPTCAWFQARLLVPSQGCNSARRTPACSRVTLYTPPVIGPNTTFALTLLPPSPYLLHTLPSPHPCSSPPHLAPPATLFRRAPPSSLTLPACPQCAGTGSGRAWPTGKRVRWETSARLPTGRRS